MCMPLLFKGNTMGYFAEAALGVAAGLLAAALSLLPHGTLWSFSSFGSGTIGFWMFSTSTIVLLSASPRVAAANSGIYVGLMFAVTGIFKTLRLIYSEYYFTSGFLSMAADLLLYSVIPGLVCSALGTVLWYGRKGGRFSRLLLAAPLIVTAAEAAIMFFRVAAEGTMLFQAVLDTGCAAAYLFISRRGLFGLKKE